MLRLLINIHYSNVLETCSHKSTQRTADFRKEAHYLHIAQVSDLESQHGDPDHPKNLTNCSLYHHRANLID